MPIELSKKQIAELFTFVEKKYVRYIDVQYELVDHLATAIEQEMEYDSTLSFKSALNIVYSRFPITGFDKFVSEKEKSMLSYWRRRMRSIVMEYLSLPKIGLLILLCLLYGLLCTLHTKWCIMLFMSVSMVAITYVLFTQNLGLKKLTKKYLVLDKFYQATAGFSFLPLGLYPWFSEILPDTSLSYIDWQLYLFSIVFAFLTILMHASMYEFPNYIKQEINKKYSHLDIKMA